MNHTLDDTDQRLIVATQGGLPLVSHPYQAVARQLGLAEEDVLNRVLRLVDYGVIRRVAAVPTH